MMSVDIGQIACLEVLAEAICHDYLVKLPYSIIIEESIAEEKAMNQDLVVCLYQDVVDSVLHQEWFQMLVEGQVGEEGLDLMWKIMPLSAKHQVWKSRTQKMIKKLSWMVYSDILNDIVAGTWLNGILESADDEEDLDKVMPIPDYEAMRKKWKNSIGLGLSMWKYLSNDD